MYKMVSEIKMDSYKEVLEFHINNFLKETNYKVSSKKWYNSKRKRMTEYKRYLKWKEEKNNTLKWLKKNITGMERTGKEMMEERKEQNSTRKGVWMVQYDERNPYNMKMEKFYLGVIAGEKKKAIDYCKEHFDEYYDKEICPKGLYLTELKTVIPVE